MANKQLSIVIPTYNRADFLNYSLEVHIPLARRYNIQICIFDNASTDTTEEVVTKWMKQYIHLIYHKHETNIGGIMNFEYALKYPQTDYIWLIGDTYKINNNVIDYVLEVLNTTNHKLDAIVLNLQGRINIPAKNYTDANLLLNELGALMTCAAISILSKDMIKEEILQRYRLVWFTHTAIIFEAIANKDFLIHWAQKQSVEGLEHSSLNKTNWSHTSKAFEIGCEDWANFVMSLPPSYNIHNKMKCIMDFGKVSHLFTLKNVIFLRLHGILTYTTFKKYRFLFSLTINIPLVFIFILSITPKLFLQIAGIIAITFFGKNKIKKIKQLMRKETN